MHNFCTSIKFGFVPLAVSWNSRLPKMPNHKLPQLPWLFQAIVNNKGTSHGLFNLPEKKFYQVDLPEAQGKLLKGSSHGWLVIVDNTASSPDIIYLINLPTRVQIQLPPRSTFPDVENYCEDRVNEEYCLCGEFYIDPNHVHLSLTYKVVTSSIPSSEDCVVVAIYGEYGDLAWCARNHKKWTKLDVKSDSNVIGPIDDVIFSKNKLYTANANGYLLEVENIGPHPKVTLIAAGPPLLPLERVASRRSLVECSDGSLIMLNVYFDDFICGFKAYKLYSMNSCWHAVINIGNDMLFLGHNLSFSVPSCDFSGYSGNRKYFTDDPLLFMYQEGVGDAEIGVFNLEDGSMEPLPGSTPVPRSPWPSPVWVMPPNYL